MPQSKSIRIITCVKVLIRWKCIKGEKQISTVICLPSFKRHELRCPDQKKICRMIEMTHSAPFVTSLLGTSGSNALTPLEEWLRYCIVGLSINLYSASRSAHRSVALKWEWSAVQCHNGRPIT